MAVHENALAGPLVEQYSHLLPATLILATVDAAAPATAGPDAALAARADVEALADAALRRPASSS